MKTFNGEDFYSFDFGACFFPNKQIHFNLQKNMSATIRRNAIQLLKSVFTSSIWLDNISTFFTLHISQS